MNSFLAESSLLKTQLSELEQKIKIAEDELNKAKSEYENSKTRYISVLLGGVIDIVFVAGGYFICEYFMYGKGAAASIPANIIQGVGGLIISAVLYPALIAIPYVRQQSLIFTSKKQE